jgi:hypothetical protein
MNTNLTEPKRLPTAECLESSFPLLPSVRDSVFASIGVIRGQKRKPQDLSTLRLLNLWHRHLADGFHGLEAHATN